MTKWQRAIVSSEIVDTVYDLRLLVGFRISESVVATTCLEANGRIVSYLSLVLLDVIW